MLLDGTHSGPLVKSYRYNFQDFLCIMAVILVTYASYFMATFSQWSTDLQAVCAQVWWYGWLTALCTGLGAFPMVCLKFLSTEDTNWWEGLMNSIAAGMMTCASWTLTMEACALIESPDLPQGMLLATDEATANIDVELQLVAPHSYYHLALGLLLGITFMLATKSFVEQHEDLKFNGLKGLSAQKALLILGVMTVHSFTEGVGIGVSFARAAPSHLGLFITLSLALHNVPEGLAVSITMVPRGLPILHAAFWSIFTSLPQPIMAVPALLFVERFWTLLPVGLGFAAGAMAFMCLTELFPEAVEAVGKTTATVTAVAAFGAMFGLQAAFRTGIML